MEQLGCDKSDVVGNKIDRPPCMRCPLYLMLCWVDVKFPCHYNWHKNSKWITSLIYMKHETYRLNQPTGCFVNNLIFPLL